MSKYRKWSIAAIVMLGLALPLPNGNAAVMQPSPDTGPPGDIGNPFRCHGFCTRFCAGLSGPAYAACYAACMVACIRFLPVSVEN